MRWIGRVVEVSDVHFSFSGEIGEMKLFSLIDLAKNEFGPIMVFQNAAVARRWLLDNLPPSSEEVRHAQDFVLMDLGEFDRASGVISSRVPLHVAVLAEILRGPVPHVEEMADGSR